MRMTKVLGLAVLLVAMAVAVNALAFKSADVTSSMKFKVVSTELAGLALLQGAGDGADSTIGADGIMTIGLSTSPQPNSTYVYTDVFRVKNNAAATKTVTLPTSLSLGNAKVTVTFVDDTGADITSFTVAAKGATGDTKNVGIKVVVASDFTTGGNTLGNDVSTQTVLIKAQ